MKKLVFSPESDIIKIYDLFGHYMGYFSYHHGCRKYILNTLTQVQFDVDSLKEIIKYIGGLK